MHRGERPTSQIMTIFYLHVRKWSHIIVRAPVIFLKCTQENMFHAIAARIELSLWISRTCLHCAGTKEARVLSRTRLPSALHSMLV